MQTIQQHSAPVPSQTAPAFAINRYATVEQAAHVRQAFTPAALRDMRFKAADRFNSRGEVIKGNGSAAAGVWVTIGRKVLIDLDAFDKWIESHKRSAA